MSFNLNLKCIRKVESLNGDNTYTEVVLQPESTVITPNAQNNEAEMPEYGMHGTITLTMRNYQEAEAYKVGQSYTINVVPTVVEEPTPSE